MKELHFGTAGIPHSTDPPSTPHGIKRVKELGLGAMEMEFVRGVNMGSNAAESARKASQENDVILTAHGPYYINLASEKEKIQERSIQRILNTARIADLCGAVSVTFHGGFYYKDDRQKTFEIIKHNLTEVVNLLSDEGNGVRICPEVMGKIRSFGKLHEIMSLCQEIEGIHPCLDFSHLHALKGEYNTYEEFSSVLEELERKLGKEELKDLHAHVSGIEYGERGEKKHLFLESSDMNYRDLLRAFKEFNCRGVIICESPDPVMDAVLLKNSYEEL